MNTATTPGSPASGPIAPSGALPRSPALGVESYAAGLYTAWAAIAVTADAVAAAPLAPGAGLILGVGGALTTALFFGLTRLPAADQPARGTLVAAQTLMGMVWATLYAWFVGPVLAGSLLAVGMYLSAIALALAAVNVPVLRRLMLAALLASAVGPVLQLAVLIASGGLLDAARCREWLCPQPRARRAARGRVCAGTAPGRRAGAPAKSGMLNSRPVSSASSVMPSATI